MNVMSLADIRHCVRVANISIDLADALELSYKEKEDLYISGLFHDIGKAYLRQDILNKPGRLTPLERQHIETHSVLSFREAKNVGFSDLIANNILYHHENFDGTGYPDQIEGSKIPLGARIIKITDTFDALTSERPYRRALPLPDVIQIMNQQQHHYDPDFYVLFIHLLDSLANNLYIHQERLRFGGEML